MKRKEDTSIIEEIFNAITHGLGLILAVIGSIILLNFASKHFDLTKIIGFSIFGVVLIFSYTISTLYHGLIFTKAKRILKILDHSCIFLLIAGTYTPFLLTILKGKLGLVLLLLIWILAVLGIILKVFYVHKFKRLSLVFYLFMGWIIIFAIKPMLAALPLGVVGLIALGGLFYTVGTVFYSWKKLPLSHAIWHLFVLGGSVCHFFAMFYLQ